MISFIVTFPLLSVAIATSPYPNSTASDLEPVHFRLKSESAARRNQDFGQRNITNYPIGNEDTLVVHHHCQSDVSSQFLLFCKSINTD